jgi:hypothetical protein
MSSPLERQENRTELVYGYFSGRMCLGFPDGLWCLTVRAHNLTRAQENYVLKDSSPYGFQGEEREWVLRTYG